MSRFSVIDREDYVPTLSLAQQAAAVWQQSAPVAQQSSPPSQHSLFPSQQASPAAQHSGRVAAEQQSAPDSQQGKPSAQQSVEDEAFALNVIIASERLANDAKANFANIIVSLFLKMNLFTHIAHVERRSEVFTKVLRVARTSFKTGLRLFVTLALKSPCDASEGFETCCKRRAD